MSHTKLETTLLKRLQESALVKPKKEEGENLIIRSKTGTEQSWLFDLRALITVSDDIDLITEVFWERMADKWPFQVGGLEVGAIPLVTGIVMKGREKGFKVNSFIVRKSRKKAGMCKQIEGTLSDDPIIVVDDLVNSGSSFKRVVVALEQEGKTIDTAFAYIDFGREAAKDYFAEIGVNFESIYQLSDFGLNFGKPELYSFDKNTVKPDWVFSPPNPNYVFSVPHSTPAIDDKNLYYGADNGYFYAVDKKTGTEVWSFQTGDSIKGIFSSPVLTEHGVIFGAYDGSVYHLNRKDGSVIWDSAIAEYVGSSPCLAEDLGLVFIGLEHNIRNNRGAIVALNLETGEKEWEHFTEDYMHSTPAYCAEERLVTVGCNDGKVLLLDAKKGLVYWKFEMGGPLKMAPTFDLKRRQIIAPCFDKNVYGIDIDTGQETFRFAGGHAFYNTALVVEDKAYVGGCDKYFYIYDLAKNKLLKKMPVIGRVLSSPRLINQTIWFGVNDGGIRQIDLDGNYVGGVYLPERPVSSVIYDETMDYYFVVTMGNYLVSLKPFED